MRKIKTLKRSSNFNSKKFENRFLEKFLNSLFDVNQTISIVFMIDIWCTILRPMKSLTALGCNSF